MVSLISGARAFLREVFAHRLRQREQFIESFRRASVDELPGKVPEQEGAQHLFEQRNKAR